MTAIRLVPVAPFVVVNLAAGAIRVRYWHFALGTVLGMLPGALVATTPGRPGQDGPHPGRRIQLLADRGPRRARDRGRNRISQARAQAVFRRAPRRQCAYAGLGASRTARPGRARYGDRVKRTATLPTHGTRGRHFSMIREFHLADFLTLANAACGTGAIFLAMLYTGHAARRRISSPPRRSRRSRSCSTSSTATSRAGATSTRRSAASSTPWPM